MSFKKSIINTVLGALGTIGIVIIPGNHAVHGTNTCVMMSLVEMACSTPQIGSLTSEPMCFSAQIDHAEVSNFNVVVIKDSDVLKTNGKSVLNYDFKNGINTFASCMGEAEIMNTINAAFGMAQNFSKGNNLELWICDVMANLH